MLLDVGVLSWAASTAASAPPWSLYETLADITHRQTTWTGLKFVLESSCDLQTDLKCRTVAFNGELPAEENFSEISNKFLHAEAEA